MISVRQFQKMATSLDGQNKAFSSSIRHSRFRQDYQCLMQGSDGKISLMPSSIPSQKNVIFSFSSSGEAMLKRKNPSSTPTNTLFSRRLIPRLFQLIEAFSEVNIFPKLMSCSENMGSPRSSGKTLIGFLSSSAILEDDDRVHLIPTRGPYAFIVR